jgi:hypothetical protein
MINIAKEVIKKPDLLHKVLILKGDHIFKICSTYKEAIKLAKNKEELIIYKVPKNINAVRILPLRIKNFKKHPWCHYIRSNFF